ncbi:MAG: phosphoribosylanthranilate isomerase [Clostridia bacterium]|nr:phosphoribosylanthranilate isomerase [Deltaproteobacteria bacterium]
MNVKICGITRLEDARVALELGASHIGFIFHETSPRYIAPKDVFAIAVALGPSVQKVGVFVNQPPERVRAVMEATHLDIAQLHGDETPEIARAAWPNVWKALRVRDAASPDESDAALALADSFNGPILLDARSDKALGGTGTKTDWAVALRVKQKHRVILAGGISPFNVQDAARVVDPWTIDVSSGVEDAPGIKSRKKMTDLFRLIGTCR